MKAYSLDLRTRVVDAIGAGMTQTNVSTTFQVSTATINRWLAQRRTTGDLTAKTPPGRPPTLRPTDLPLLQFQLETMPDATLAAHAEQWQADTDTALSQWTIGRAIRRLGWSRKKSR